MEYSNWVLCAFNSSTQATLFPTQSAGWHTIRFIDRDASSTNPYYLIIIYSNEVDESEIEKALEIGVVNSTVPVVLLFHTKQESIIKKVIKKKLNRHVVPLADNLPEIVRNVEFWENEAQANLKSSKVKKTIITIERFFQIIEGADMTRIIGVSNAFDYVDAIIYEAANGQLSTLAREVNDEVIQKDDVDHAVQRINTAISKVLSSAKLTHSDITSIGIATPGTIEKGDEVLFRSSHFAPTRTHIPLAKMVSQENNNLPTKLIKDTNARLLAELRLGAARGSQDVFYVLADWGIGGALAINGSPYKGAFNVAGEFGHVKLTERGGPICNCRERGCVEAIASLEAVLEAISAQIKGGIPSKLEARLREVQGNFQQISYNELKFAARSDELTGQVLEEAANALGRAISSVLNVLNPELVVLGGTMAHIGVFAQQVETAAHQGALKAIWGEGPGHVRFVIAERDEEGELQGAALFAYEESTTHA